MATQGLANYLKQGPLSDRPVFIGYDVRNHSREFALETALVLAGNGIPVFLTKDICPTPLVSFGCRHFNCQAAIMITASHNPPEYNGYKVYWADGGQIVAPHDQGIIKQIKKIASLNEVHLASKKSSLIRFIGDELDAAYLKELRSLRLYDSLPPINILYTPLHGTGIRIIPTALKTWGFPCSLIEEQKDPDGNFTNTPSPNPEEAKALQLGANRLVSEQADLLIGTDPDADRVGIAVLHQEKALLLTGNQIACLCLHHICEALSYQGQSFHDKLFIKTIVTTELFKKIAASYGAECIDVLTGFKYIAEQIALSEHPPQEKKYLFGGEESYGYLFGTFVRDKDAVSSSCLIAEMTALAKREKITLVDRLHQLYRLYGIHRESLTNIALSDNQAGIDQVAQIMNHLRQSLPSRINRLLVTQCDDYLSKQSKNLQTKKMHFMNLPKSDVLRFWLEDGSKLVIRPSGTEPKIKIYAETTEKSDDIEAAIQTCEEKLHSLVEAFKRDYL